MDAIDHHESEVKKLSEEVSTTALNVSLINLCENVDILKFSSL